MVRIKVWWKRLRIVFVAVYVVGTAYRHYFTKIIVCLRGGGGGGWLDLILVSIFVYAFPNLYVTINSFILVNIFFINSVNKLYFLHTLSTSFCDDKLIFFS